MTGKWEKLTYLPLGLILICQNQLQKVETMILKWVTEKGQNLKHPRSWTFRLYHISVHLLLLPHIHPNMIATVNSEHLNSFNVCRSQTPNSEETGFMYIYRAQKCIGKIVLCCSLCTQRLLWRSVRPCTTRHLQ
jgi:hypothetical protein